jgi:hypothetical protein
MSLQQALEVVKLQHVFWHKELCRAPEEELQDCELFRQQCELEIEILEVELEIPAIQRTRSDLRRRKPSEPSLSNARPRTTVIGGHATRKKATRWPR